MNIKALMPPRLLEWYNIGPLQRAQLDEFVEELLKRNVSAITADGHAVKPGDAVYVLSSTGKIEATRVLPTEAITDYYLFGNIPVSSSFSSKVAAQNYKDHAL